jgi:predicted phage tail protein
MKEKFPKIFALLGVEAMECKEDGTFFNASLLETLEGKIGEMEQANADAKALAEQLTNEKNELTAKVESLTTEHAAAIEQMNADHAQAIDTLKAEHQTKVDELNALVEEKQNAIAALEQEKADLQADVNAKAENIETLTTELNGAKAAVATAEQTIAERDQQISDLNAQIAELEQNPGDTPQAGAAPKTNGQGAQAPTVGVGQYVYDPNLSYKENMKRKDAFEQGK